ncbi:MAG: type II toxin-antitoxin system RelE/ParE family toxin [Myxococcaceae bacterium]|nr:type II toxin-antitoxin system RelE/ParE family toxin [Myxococcaceae bacterium]
MKLVVSPQAAEDIEEAIRWWQEHRLKAPGLLESELARALEFVMASPRACAVLVPRGPVEVRRVPLPRSRYFVYFRIMDDEVRVLRLWHMSRASPPEP